MKNALSPKKVLLAAAGTAVILVASLSTAFGHTASEPDDLEAGMEPVASGPVTTVHVGRDFGLDWTLTANNSNQGLCVDLHLSGPVNLDTGGCGSPVPLDRQLGLMVDTLPSVGGSFLYGETAPSIVKIAAITADGDKITVPTVHESSTVAAANFDVNFYVMAIPDDVAVVVVQAIDASNDVLDRIQLKST